MKKLIVIFAVVYFSLNAMMNSVKANDYSKAVIGHVITNSSEIDHGKLLEAEMQKLAHKFALESLEILQAYLPSIIDGINAKLRADLDKEYKCLLLKGTAIEDDCANWYFKLPKTLWLVTPRIGNHNFGFFSYVC